MQHATPGTEVNVMDTPLGRKAYAWQRFGKWDGTLDRMQSKDAQNFWRIVNKLKSQGVVSL